MILEKIVIKGFGKFNDHELSLDEGLNIIYGPNEAGKSTLMDFIFMIFYGNQGRKTSVENLRVKYRPLGGGPMAGTLYFSHKGKSYRLDRTFNESNKKDQVSLRILPLNEEIYLPSNDVGQELLGISAETFKNTMFIRQEEIVYSGRSDLEEVNTRLQALMTGGENAISYGETQAVLDEKRQELLSKNGKNGLIPELEGRLRDLRLELDEAMSLEASKDDLGKRMRDLDGQKASILGKKAEIKRLIAKAGPLEDLKDLRAKAQKLEMEILTVKEQAETTKRLKGLLKEKEGLVAEKDELEKLNSYNLADKRGLMARLEDEDRAFDEVERKRAEAQAAIRDDGASILSILKTLTMAFGAIAGILLAAYFLLPNLQSSLKFMLIGSFILFAATGLYYYLSLKRTGDIRESNESLAASLADLASKRDKIKLRRARVQSDLELLTNEIIKNEAKIEMVDRQLASIEAEYADLDRGDRIYIDPLVIRLNEEKLKGLKEAYSKKLADLLAIYPEIQGGDPLEDLERLLAGYRERSEALDRQYNQIEKEEAGLNASLKEKYQRGRAVSEVEYDIYLTGKELDEKRRKLDILNKTKDHLDEAYRGIQKDLIPLLNEEASKIFAGFTSGKHEKLLITPNLELLFEDELTGRVLEYGYLSQGTIDQAYLSLRLAITKLLFDMEGSLLVLDDIFVKFDQERMKSAVGYLRAAAEKYGQVLLFTCRDLDVPEKKYI